MGKNYSKPKVASSALDRDAEQSRRKQEKNMKQKRKLGKKGGKGTKKASKIKKGNDPKSDKFINEDLNLSDYHQKVLQKLQNQLRHDIPAFLCNNLILSTQFFGNYESEKAEAYEKIQNNEIDLNKTLTNYTVIYPNVLDYAVEQKIKFQQKHGAEKNLVVPLQTQTVYIVFENIEVIRTEDTNYESMSECKVVLDMRQPTGNILKGFVKLPTLESYKSNEKAEIEFEKHRKQILQKRQQQIQLDNRDDDDDDDDDSDSDYNETMEEDVYENSTKQSISTTSTLRTPTSSDYEYSYITSLNTHQPLSHLTESIYSTISDINSTSFPDSCITGIPTIAQLENLYKPCARFNGVEMKYLNSRLFFRYFAMNLLKGELANSFSISEDELAKSTWKGASIHTAKYEIIPAIHSAWPSIASEWLKRDRKRIINPINKTNLTWPNQQMQQRVVSFGCHIIPLGYVPKIGRNSMRELEWKIVFPKAERYLETCLTRAQVKIFMLSKVLIKTFIEPQEDKKTYMFSLDHLRTHLFWECEKNYGAFPEEYLGEVLIRFLREFRDKISKKKLQDYFLNEYNLFENIPEKALVELHQIISQVIDNPVMYIMMAYRNLNQIGKSEFYPTLNYKALYKSIVTKNPLLAKDNFQRHFASNNIEEGDIDIDTQKFKDKGLIRFTQTKDEKSKRRRTKIMQKNRKKSIRESKDSIDLKFIVPKMPEHLKYEEHNKKMMLADIRREVICEKFIEFFTLMGNKSHTMYKSYDQATIYLDQAENLYELYKNFDNYKDILAENIKKQKVLLEQVQKNSIKPITIQTPARNPRLDGLIEEDRRVSDEYIDVDFPSRTTTKSDTHVKFAENPQMFEPRSFFTEAVVHSSNVKKNGKTQSEKLKNNAKKNGIIKQKSIEEKITTPISHISVNDESISQIEFIESVTLQDPDTTTTVHNGKVLKLRTDHTNENGDEDHTSETTDL